MGIGKAHRRCDGGQSFGVLGSKRAHRAAGCVHVYLRAAGDQGRDCKSPDAADRSRGNGRADCIQPMAASRRQACKGVACRDLANAWTGSGPADRHSHSSRGFTKFRGGARYGSNSTRTLCASTARESCRARLCLPLRCRSSAVTKASTRELSRAASGVLGAGCGRRRERQSHHLRGRCGCRYGRRDPSGAGGVRAQRYNRNHANGD